MKKIWKHLFNQNMLYILLMLVQIAFLVLSVLFLNRNYAWVYGALLLLNGLLIIYITNSRKNPTYKNAWLVVIAVLPIFGGLSYLFLKTRRDTRIFFRNYKQQMEQTKPLLTQEPDAARHLFNDSQQVYNLSTYLQHTGFPVYEQTNVTYFPLGEEQFAEMKNRLREAKRFIFIENFIIAPGKMWNEFLEILIERARAGVEVRLMYDGFGTKFFSTGDFLKIAKQHHIQCRCFNPFRPLLSSAQNNRDHRKILVIDGNIAFNGGTNLADEYINEKVRFGHWKDTAIMLEGAAVWSYTMMFLQLWNMNNPNKKEAYDHLVLKIDGRLIEKTRYLIPLDGCLSAELDVFEGDLAPLTLVEVEFDSVDAANEFTAPDWFGEDVTESGKYHNSYLSRLENS